MANIPNLDNLGVDLSRYFRDAIKILKQFTFFLKYTTITLIIINNRKNYYLETYWIRHWCRSFNISVFKMRGNIDKYHILNSNFKFQPTSHRNILSVTQKSLGRTEVSRDAYMTLRSMWTFCAKFYLKRSDSFFFNKFNYSVFFIVSIK